MMITNGQFGQRIRQSHELSGARPYRAIPRSSPYDPQSTARLFAQGIRRDHERRFRAKQLPIARRSGWPTYRHELGRCDVLCSFCGADHWIEERVQGSSKSSPRFSTCCGGGTIMMDKFEDPPEPLFSLLKDTTPGIFLHHILTDNQWP